MRPASAVDPTGDAQKSAGSKYAPPVETELAKTAYEVGVKPRRSVKHLKPELPSFERHKRRAEVVPFDAPSVDDHAWLTSALIAVPFNAASNDHVPDLQAASIGL